MDFFVFLGDLPWLFAYALVAAILAAPIIIICAFIYDGLKAKFNFPRILLLLLMGFIGMLIAAFVIYFYLTEVGTKLV